MLPVLIFFLEAPLGPPPVPQFQRYDSAVSAVVASIGIPRQGSLLYPTELGPSE